MANDNQKDNLAEVASLAVTMTGRRPSSVSWELTVDQIIEDTSSLLKALVPAITDITVEVDQYSNNVMAFAWLPANSDHLVDSTTKGLFGKAIPAFSKEVKEVIEKYSPKNTKRVIAPQKGTANNLSAIPIDLRKTLSVLMDENGSYSKSKYNGIGVKSRIYLEAIFHENSAKERRLIGVKVTKSTTTGNYRRPKPTPSFHY